MFQLSLINVGKVVGLLRRLVDVTVILIDRGPMGQEGNQSGYSVQKEFDKVYVVERRLVVIAKEILLNLGCQVIYPTSTQQSLSSVLVK